MSTFLRRFWAVAAYLTTVVAANWLTARYGFVPGVVVTYPDPTTGRFPHTCPDTECHACDIEEEAKAKRREDRNG